MVSNVPIFAGTAGIKLHRAVPASSAKLPKPSISYMYSRSIKIKAKFSGPGTSFKPLKISSFWIMVYPAIP
jgi:hypothetical protein